MKKFVLFLSLLAIVLPLVLYCAYPGTAYEITMIALRKMSGLTEQKVYVGDHIVRYLEGGKGETVILLHGFQADKDTWTLFVKSLTPHCRVIAIDILGFGESSKPENHSYSISSQVEFLNRIVNVMKPGRFHIGGHSMGGAIAGRYVAEYPEKVSSLALFNTSGVTTPVKSRLQKMMKKGQNPFVIRSFDDYEKMLNLVFEKQIFFPGLFKSHHSRLAIRSRTFNKKIIEQIMEEKYSLENDFSRISIPTFVLWGDKDKVVDVSAVRVLKKGIKNTKTVVIKKCGHIPMIEHPEETARHYLRFLTSD